MRLQIESLVFRAIVLATLVISATLFATRQPINSKLAEVKQPSADHQAHDEHAEKTVFGVGAEGWTAIFTGVLAVFTMGLAGATYALIVVTKRGITEQAELTRQSLRHARTSAMTAERAIDASSQSSERQLRAYILVEEAVIESIAIPGRFIAKINFKNFGQTVGYNVIIKRRIVVGYLDKNILIDLAEKELRADPPFISGPGQQSSSAISFEHRQVMGDIPFATEGARTVIIDGEITYDDAFGQSRCTTFRFRAKADHSLGLYFIPWPIGNTAT